MYLDPLTASLRLLAKSNYYQTIFTFMKEGPFRLFENDTDLTSLQLDFLVYLSFYDSIKTDISLGEVSPKVLDNFVYEDAYCIYRNTKRQTSSKSVATSGTNTSRTYQGSQQRDSWHFKSRPKKK